MLAGPVCASVCAACMFFHVHGFSESPCFLSHLKDGNVHFCDVSTLSSQEERGNPVILKGSGFKVES